MREYNLERADPVQFLVDFNQAAEKYLITWSHSKSRDHLPLSRVFWSGAVDRPRLRVAQGMALLRPARLTPADFKRLIRQRGWQMADAAARWAIQPETLSRVAADPEREIRWDDLVRALPTLTRRERAAATAARLQLYPRRPRAAKALPVAPASKEGPPSTLYSAAFCLDG